MEIIEEIAGSAFFGLSSATLIAVLIVLLGIYLTWYRYILEERISLLEFEIHSMIREICEKNDESDE